MAGYLASFGFMISYGKILARFIRRGQSVEG